MRYNLLLLLGGSVAGSLTAATVWLLGGDVPATYVGFTMLFVGGMLLAGMLLDRH